MRTTQKKYHLHACINTFQWICHLHIYIYVVRILDALTFLRMKRLQQRSRPKWIMRKSWRHSRLSKPCSCLYACTWLNSIKPVHMQFHVQRLCVFRVSNQVWYFQVFECPRPAWLYRCSTWQMTMCMYITRSPCMKISSPHMYYKNHVANIYTN